MEEVVAAALVGAGLGYAVRFGQEQIQRAGRALASNDLVVSTTRLGREAVVGGAQVAQAGARGAAGVAGAGGQDHQEGPGERPDGDPRRRQARQSPADDLTLLSRCDARHRMVPRYLLPSPGGVAWPPTPVHFRCLAWAAMEIVAAVLALVGAW